MATTTSSRLEKARQLWGSVTVVGVKSLAPRAVSFGRFPVVAAAPRLSRVTEQIRNIEGNKLDRSTTR